MPIHRPIRKFPSGKKVPATLGLPILILLSLSGCMENGSGPRDGNSNGKHMAVTRMTSASLRPAANAAPGASKSSADEPAVQRCDFGHPCLTPDDFEGRVHSGNFMVGGNGGAPGVPLRVVEGYDTSYHGPDTDRGGNMVFNLRTATELGGAYRCCEGGNYPPDDLAIVRRMEFTFDYLDVTFTIPAATASPLAGKTYTIRTVYVDTGSAEDLAGGHTALIQGDKLLRGPGETAFSWCTETECGKSLRPENPLQAAWMSDAGFPGGYPHYAQVALILKKDFIFTKSDAEKGNWLFTVDFDLSRAATFRTGDLALLKSEADLVKAFDMYAGDGGPGAIGVKVDLTKTLLDSSGTTVP